MPRLVVLDLSHNKNLRELPDGLSQLVSLRYLNMSHTSIQCLPVGLQELKNLRHLDLEWTGKLSSIVGISALLSLKVLKLRGSKARENTKTVEELQVLEHLEVLTLEISYDSGLDQFLSSHKLMCCTQALEISGLQLESSHISRIASMDKVSKLVFEGCTLFEIKIDIIASSRSSKTVSPLQNPENVCFFSLSRIYLSSCKRLKELTWLMFAPNLTKLFVEGAYELEDIINKEKASVRDDDEPGLVLFRKLEIIHLANLPEVKNIYWRPLPFPCLTDIIVLDCPKLRKLPLNSKSGSGGENGLFIKYRDKGWIKGVEWEDEATKARFLTLIP
ncbi:PREDICTED: putative disease resistance protein At1g63350 [Camelina sativa]|uniref:Disease resistance protein At1g63350 n=1 Tax=Camelina sativa TaxID=90675 RepID=A0ABM0T1F6_CAMSA|nr:PREDICTED: putative disease resistance protein At1g63350 [Camelina sativa]